MQNSTNLSDWTKSTNLWCKWRNWEAEVLGCKPSTISRETVKVRRERRRAAEMSVWNEACFIVLVFVWEAGRRRIYSPSPRVTITAGWERCSVCLQTHSLILLISSQLMPSLARIQEVILQRHDGQTPARAAVWARLPSHSQSDMLKLRVNQ